jgi:predicted RND superfamily exporter protein
LIIRGPRAAKLVARKDPLPKEAGGENPLAGALNAIAQKKALVIVITALVMVISAIGASRVVVDNAMVEFFNEEAEVSRADRFIREHFGGSTQLILSVEADDTETLLSPETLSALDGLCSYLVERVPRVTKVIGFTDMIKRVNQLFNVDEPPDGAPSGVRGVARINEDSGDVFGDFGFGTDDGALRGVLAEGTPRERLAAVRSAGGAPEHAVGDRQGLRGEAPRRGGSVRPKGWSAGETSPASPESSITFAMLNAAAGKRSDMSASELARELERITNYEGYAYYEIPADPARYGKATTGELEQLIANYLALLAGQTDDSKSNDPLEPTAIETLIPINSQWQKDSQNVIRAVDDYVAANFPANTRVLAGGGATQEAAVARLVVNSQIISILGAVLIVLVIVAVSYQSLAVGLIAALPLTIASAGNFAVMGFIGVPINITTALIASLAVGIGIDYTIHFIDAFKREKAAIFCTAPLPARGRRY